MKGKAETGAAVTIGREAARALRLQLVREDEDQIELAGERKGARIQVRRIAETHAGTGEPRWAWTASVARDDFPAALRFRPERQALRRQGWLIDHLSGDDRFDAEVRIAGEEAASLAFLDNETRGRVLDLFAKGHAEIEAGAVRVARYVKSSARMPQRLIGDVSIAVRLMRRGAEMEVADQLFENARRDPLGPVRLRNLELLAQVMPARVDKLPRRSFESILDIAVRAGARIAAGEALPEGLLQRLLELLAVPQIAHQLGALLEKASERTMERFLPLIGAHPELMPRLGERALLRVVTDGDRALRLGAIAQLERIGGPHAAKVLAPYTSGLFKRAELKDAARRAVAAIEARAEEQRGRLALAPGAEGALSLRPEAGALALHRHGEDHS